LAKVYDGCRSASIGCIECKGWAADGILREIEPIRERRAHYEAQPALVTEILAAGAQKARGFAETTMVEVRGAIGL
jgi:tryptophanyl-tRNA synthetase